MKKNNDLFVCAVLEKRLLVMCIVFAVFLFIMIEMSEFNTKKTDELIEMIDEWEKKVTSEMSDDEVMLLKSLLFKVVQS